MDFVPTFLKEWRAQEAALPEHCCMGINHMFGLSFLVHTLKPSAIIESGVSAGHQTFLLRLAAGKSVPILAFDPLDPTSAYPSDGKYGHWKDPSGVTRYFVGSGFKDFAEVDWDRLIPDKSIRQRTLVVLDDRQSSVERFRIMQKYGFKWAYYVENYPVQTGTSSEISGCGTSHSPSRDSSEGLRYPSGGAFSPNAVCGAPLAPSTKHVLYKDKFGAKCAFLTRDQHSKMLNYMKSSLKTYFKFPALFSPCAEGGKTTLLGYGVGDRLKHRLLEYRLPTQDREVLGYGHLFPAFIELTPGTDPGDPLQGTLPEMVTPTVKSHAAPKMFTSLLATWVVAASVSTLLGLDNA